ncbi:MAG: NAD(P)H-hydrate epimerase, partial [Lachnospiraceae bacterium]|nr:NAD(P)H-hydrate epimerase [Lachnospiraceae bacterium]
MKYLVSGKEMKNWEMQAMENYKIPSLLLMERAAQKVVDELLCGSYQLKNILIACGMGNNGGDGLAVARMLLQKGYDVQVCMVGALDKLTPEAKVQLEMYQALDGKFVTAPDYDEYTVIVDAIYGIGCNRDISGIGAEVIEGINHSKALVIAVDVPSGVSSDSGKICGVAVNAHTTVTFFTEKLGMMLYPGREYCGKIVVADLGIPFEKCEACNVITYTEEDRKRLPVRKGNSHKGTFGKVLVIAGSAKISGAAYLASASAYRMGAGLVKIYTPEENRLAMQMLLPEALLECYDANRPLVNQLKECMEWANVIVIGPGLGTERVAEKIFRYVIKKSKVPVVVDADGINLLARNKKFL